MSMEAPIGAGESPDEGRIERSETGVRVLMSLLFFLIVQVVEAVLTVLILFELGFALVTQREPSATVKRFAERVLEYTIEIVHYLTYNDDSPPFPFRELPAARGADD